MAVPIVGGVERLPGYFQQAESRIGKRDHDFVLAGVQWNIDVQVAIDHRVVATGWPFDFEPMANAAVNDHVQMMLSPQSFDAFVAVAGQPYGDPIVTCGCRNVGELQSAAGPRGQSRHRLFLRQIRRQTHRSRRRRSVRQTHRAVRDRFGRIDVATDQRRRQIRNGDVVKPTAGRFFGQPSRSVNIQRQ